jgi:gliding motility-associated-like protein
VSLAPTPSAYAGADDTLCAGASVLLTGASAVGTNVLWSAASGSFLPSDSLQTTYTADTAASGPVALVLTVQDSCGMASDTLVIQVLPALQVTVTHPDTVCNLSPVQLSYSSNGINHLWIGNGTFSDSSGSPTTFSPAAGQQGALVVGLIAQGQCGTDTVSASYFVETNVLAAFTWTPTTVYPGTWVEFENASQPSSSPVYWEFGDGFSSAEAAPTHQYFSAGTYPVALIAYGAGGCNDTLELPLVVIQPDTLIPNVFSPNGDGINDAFDIFGERLPPAVRSFNLGIFDRWGRQVFVSTDPNVRWEGNTEGRALPDGVYYYVLQMEPLTGGTLNYAGPVTLVR